MWGGMSQSRGSTPKHCNISGAVSGSEANKQMPRATDFNSAVWERKMLDSFACFLAQVCHDKLPARQNRGGRGGGGGGR